MDYHVEPHGFAFCRQVMEPPGLNRFTELLGPVTGAGRRGLLREAAVAELARSEGLLALVRPHVPAEPLPVRAIYFDKSPEANWLVAWHQDLTLAVRARAEVPGFGPWSTKEGVPHVQPPMALLEQMLAVRLHFDDADEVNGALRVMPETHRLGRLSAESIQTFRSSRPEVLCAAAAGDALLMRPLLLHASGRSTSPRHRRVLHLEYAGFQLPPELEWNEAAVPDRRANSLNKPTGGES
ncbi:MAG: phytanoyl-CoA dioxygenase [Proteobacteria bacterium]|nr:phytanoyl-CoA dioxygenase [Pseudomonadota bacterium]